VTGSRGSSSAPTVASALSASRLGDMHVVATLRARGCGGDDCNQGLSGLKVLDGVVSGGNQIFYGVLDVAAGTTCSGGVSTRSTPAEGCGG